MNKVVEIFGGEYSVCENHAEYLGCNDVADVLAYTDEPCSVDGCPSNR